MILGEVQKFFEENKGTAEVQEYLAGLRKPTQEGINAYLETEDGKKLLQPKLDGYFTKGLETWKSKTLPTEIEKEILKRFPAETEEQKRLRKLEAELESEKKARVRESMKSKALSYATQKNLPIDLVEYFVADDETGTDLNLSRLEKIWADEVKKAVEVRFKDGGRNPHPDTKPPDLDAQILAAEASGDKMGAIGLKLQKLANKAVK